MTRLIAAEFMKTRTRWLPFHLPSVGEEEIAEVVDTLRSGWLTTGAKTQRFETEFARGLGARDALALSSGTAALHLGRHVAVGEVGVLAQWQRHVVEHR